MDKILIEGTEYNVDLSGFQVEYGLNDTQTYTYSTSGELELFGDAARAIESVFFASCDGQRATMQVSIYKACCDKWFYLTLDYEGVTFCPSSCAASISPRRVTDESRCYKYLKDTIFWKEGFIDAFEHPKVYYCENPGFILWIAMLLSTVLFQVLIVVNTILVVIRALCSLVGGDNCDDIGDNIPTPCEILTIITGCGRYSPSPRILDILEYHTSQCGLGFKSSIFQDTIYRNTVLFQLQYEKGISITENSDVNWIDGNGANVTPLQILEQLKPVFNLDWRIVDGVLCVERRDYFDQLYTSIGNISGEDYCVEYQQQGACAYGRFSYTEDATDAEGNSGAPNIDDIIEWNADNEDWKDGECNVSAPYGRWRFIDDNLSKGIENLINGQRTRFRLAGTVCPNDYRRYHDLIIQNRNASQLKILVLEDGYDVQDATVIHRPVSGTDKFEYNYPLSYREFNLDGSERLDGLYAQFHAIDDPNNNVSQRMSIVDVEIDLTCDLIDIIEGAEVGLSIQTPYGIGRIGKAVIDFGRGTIKLSEIVIDCIN